MTHSRFAIAALFFVNQAYAACQIAYQDDLYLADEYAPVDTLEYVDGGEYVDYVDDGYVDYVEDDVIVVPTPTAVTNAEAKKPPGKWTDEQKLTLETFKEIVATDVENVWVVAYVDPRCRDCLHLSLEWDKLT